MIDSLKVFEKIGRRYLVVEEGSLEIEFFDYFNTDLLISVSRRLRISYRDKIVQLELSKPLDTRVLFDDRMRLLKPRRIPP